MRKIVIAQLNLNHNQEEVHKLVKRSRALIDGICAYRKELEGKGIKVFERNVNILRTVDGYYLALFQDELPDDMRPKEAKIKPFKGIDGRMKVKLIDKHGAEHVEDLVDAGSKNEFAQSRKTGMGNI